MKVRMKTLLAGPDGAIQPGQVADLPDESAQALIDGGYAEAVEPAAPVETAMPTSAPAESAMAPEASADEAMTPADGAGNDEAMDAGDEEEPKTRRSRSRK